MTKAQLHAGDVVTIRYPWRWWRPWRWVEDYIVEDATNHEGGLRTVYAYHVSWRKQPKRAQ